MLKAIRRFFLRPFALTAAAVLPAVSCGSGRQLADGEYNLVQNRIVIMGGDVAARDVASYIKQQPAGFSLLKKDPLPFSAKLMESSAENIKSHLDYLGYYNSDVTNYVTMKKSKAYATYLITPGERYRISEIRYVLPERGSFAEDFYSDTTNVSVHVGDYLSEALLEAESERSAAAMRTKGYYGFSKNYFFFEADTLSGPDSVILEMKVNEYTRNESPSSAQMLRKSMISDVTLSHSASLPFNDRILRDLNTVKPGTMYDESEINNTYRRLSALKVFNSVGVELTQTDTNRVRCDINLSESRIQGFKGELEASTNSSGLMGVSPQLTYHHKNIFHGGEWLNLSFLGNFQFKLNDNTSSSEVGASAGLSLPRFLGLPYSRFKGPNIPRTEIKASYSYQDRPEYTRSMISTSYGYSGSMRSGNLSYQLFPLQVSIVRLFDLDPEFYRDLMRNPFMRYSYQNHFDAGVGGILYYASSNAQGSKYARGLVDLSGNALSLLKKYMKTSESGEGLIWGAPFTQYVKGEINVGRTWSLGLEGSHSIATRFIAGAGYAYGNSTAVPFEKQFYCGGANSMRGWQARALGPGRCADSHSFSIPSQTGDVKLETNLEYRFNIFWKLGGALFTDVGNVWSWDESNPEGAFGKDFYKSLAADWGLGLRCDLSFFVIRIDMGMKVYDPVSDGRWLGPRSWLKRDGFAVHFGVGYPF
ncbi:MAG: BamA/TamA family outer membrane protein [Bacteroidales bacterium]|nr:BamA/TamA family outer membrane protein [Bacteroidales bacterium]